MNLTSAVVIPSFGRPRLVEEALASVRAQTRPADEIIIVDDGNPTPLQVPSTRDVRVVRHETNRGPSAARNSGIREASSDVIFYLDDDDLFEPRRIERAILCHAEGADIVACWTRLHDETHPASGRMLRGNVHDVIADTFTPSMGATSVLRRSCLLFDTALDYGEDIDWWIRASQDAWVQTVPHHDYRVRAHSGARDRTEHSRRAELAQVLMDVQREYLTTHRRALAFRYRRLGHYRRIAGDRLGAARAHLKEAQLANDPRALARAARALLVSGTTPSR